MPSEGSRQAKTLSGHGNRLGSPATAVAGESSTSVPGDFTGAEQRSADEPPPQRTSDSISARFEVDASKPTTNVQIRLADGYRMVARMNLTHTVGDIRNYINAYVRGLCIMWTVAESLVFLQFSSGEPRAAVRDHDDVPKQDARRRVAHHRGGQACE